MPANQRAARIEGSGVEEEGQGDDAAEGQGARVPRGILFELTEIGCDTHPNQLDEVVRYIRVYQAS